MLKIKKIKKQNGEVGISFALQTNKIKKKFSRVSDFGVSIFQNTKDYFRFKFKILFILLKALGANPKNISLKKEGGETLLFISGKKTASGRAGNSFDLLKNIRSKFQIEKKRTVKGTALLLILALVIQGFFSLTLFTRADESGLCSFDVDSVLIIDTTSSMADGSIISKCEWTELRQVPGKENFTHFLNKKYDITEDWCLNIRDSYDETSQHGTSKAPTYTPAIDSKIDSAKTAAKSFIDKLGGNNQSALVSLKSSSSALEKNLSDNHSSTKTAIDNLIVQPGPGTDIGGAIAQANDELGSDRGNPQALKTAILLTDGQDSNTDNINEKIQQAADADYKIFTIGLGMSVNQSQLQEIADVTGGKYHYAAHQSDLVGIFDEISQEICDFASLCEATEELGECIDDGKREHIFSWNFVFCGNNYIENVEDETCVCTYTDWQDEECIDDELRRQTRSQTSQFDYCFDLERNIEDSTCQTESEDEDQDEQDEQDEQDDSSGSTGSTGGRFRHSASPSTGEVLGEQTEKLTDEETEEAELEEFAEKLKSIEHDIERLKEAIEDLLKEKEKKESMAKVLGEQIVSNEEPLTDESSLTDELPLTDEFDEESEDFSKELSEDENIKDEDAKEDQEEQEEGEFYPLTWILLVLLLAIILSTFYFLKKSKKI